MLSTAPLLETSLDGLTLHRRGKVRDVYDRSAIALLIVATDRISAFDYVLGSGIPDKGKVLTQLSAFWFERMGDLVPHHLIVDSTSASFPAALQPHARRAARPVDARAAHRAAADRMRRARLPVRIGLEGIPADRQRLRHRLPAGLRESDRLPEPIFTPATKAETGHDVNISEEEAGADRRRATRSRG